MAKVLNEIIETVHGSRLPHGIEFLEDEGRRIFTLTKSSGEFDSFAIYLRYGDNVDVWKTFHPGLGPGCHRVGILGMCEIRFPQDFTPEDLAKRIEASASEFAEFMNA